MSWNPALDPTIPTGDAVDAIETVIVPRARDLGGFEVRRALPSGKRQMVGPFIFFDEMGPAEFLTGEGIDVRPHPHIGLATVTYLWRGRLHHRDSLGTDQWIEPGAVNWMVAGQGITHSERTDGAARAAPMSMHGLQTWVALPEKAEDDAAAFHHAEASALPVLDGEGKEVRLILGDAWGARAPVPVASETFYADAVLAAGASLPMPDNHEDRGAYVLEGTVEVGGQVLGGGADAGVPSRRRGVAEGRAAGGAADAAGRRHHGRAALYLVELRRLVERADRGRQGGLARGRLGAWPLSPAAGRQRRIHSGTRTVRVLALSGSLRAASTNTALLRGLAAAAEPPVTVVLFDGLGRLPLFNPDLEGPPAPAPVEAFAAAVANADAVVISSPEYIHALPGGLKNAVDWLVSRDEIMAKPVALLHASHRGEDALADLRRVLATVSTRFLPDLFLRFDLMKHSPDEIAALLAGPAERARLRGFLAALAAAAR